MKAPTAAEKDLAVKKETEGKPAAVPAVKDEKPKVPVRITGVQVDIEAAWRLASMLSKSDMVPKECKGEPENIMGRIIYGAEIGLAAMQAIQAIAMINGRPCLWGDTLLGLCMSHPDFGDIVETYDEEKCLAVCTVTRVGRTPTERYFSKADAQAAKLLEKDTYKMYLRRMLQMRARGFALRDSFPDKLRGIVIREEADDLPIKEINPRGREGWPSLEEQLEARANETEGARDDAPGWDAEFMAQIKEQLDQRKGKPEYMDYWNAGKGAWENGATKAQWVEIQAHHDAILASLAKPAVKKGGEQAPLV